MSKPFKPKLPKFRSAKEEALFWDKHDTTRFLSEFEPVRVEFPKPKKRLVSMRLPEPEIIGLKRIAAKKGIGYLTLIRMWVTERFFQEIKNA